MKRLLFLACLAGLPMLACGETLNLAVDPRHTFPSYEIGHNNYSFQRGRFNRTAGKITLDRENRKGSADIVIDATSVSTGVEKLEEHIRSDDFLKTKANPTITFKSSQFLFDGDRLRSAVGDLTMAGVTRPVTLDVTHFHCEPHKQLKIMVCGAEMVAKIKRSEFGIVYGLPALADEMTLRIGVEAREEKGS
jgi:polyisoprenoid-binding protein YceI